MQCRYTDTVHNGHNARERSAVPFKIHVYLTLLCSFMLLVIPSKFSYAYKQPDKGAIEVLEEILSKPDSQIDLAITKLTIDKLVDPTINIDRALDETNYCRPISKPEKATVFPCHFCLLFWPKKWGYMQQ
jgi:hypothetical protein